MDENPQSTFNTSFESLVDKVANLDPSDPANLAAARFLKTFSETSVPKPVKPEPAPEPNTFRHKALRAAAAVWESETTRAIIKAGGAFAGVATVTYATIRRDHVLDRQALDQSRQRQP